MIENASKDEKQLLEELASLKKEKTSLLYQIEDYQKNNGSEFFTPLPYQQQLIDRMWEGKTRLLLQGSNQIGKTMVGAALVDSWCRGIQAWDGRTSVFNGAPTKGRIICTDWPHHAAKVIVPKLQEIIPKGSYTTKKNNHGVDSDWVFPNGSTFQLMTIKQDTQSHESDTLHWVWSDEPLPIEKYGANCRGLVRNNGIYLLTLTAVGKESWILDLIAMNTGKNYGCVTRIPMRANTYLTEDSIVQFEKDLPDSEIPARIYGEWLQLTGMVIKQFDKDVHVIEPFDIPPTWPVVPFIDIHLNKPQAISFYTWDQYQREYQIDEIWENLSPEEIAYAILKKRQDNGWNIAECGIDPLAKGDAAYLKNRYGDVADTFTIIEGILSPQGIELFAASKDKDSGIRNIEMLLKGVNKLPALYFFAGCTDQSLWQLQRWIYDDSGIPLKKDDHFPENLYRSTLLDGGSKKRKVIPIPMHLNPDIDFADFVDANTPRGGQGSYMG